MGRRRRGEGELAEVLTEELQLSWQEARLYLRALKEKAIRQSLLEKSPDRTAAVDSLLARGMVIRAADGEDILPVHPRLALSNLFRAYEEQLVRKRKEKRLLVDRLTLELIPLYESKETNSSVAGGLGR